MRRLDAEAGKVGPGLSARELSQEDAPARLTDTIQRIDGILRDAESKAATGADAGMHIPALCYMGLTLQRFRRHEVKQSGRRVASWKTWRTGLASGTRKSSNWKLKAVGAFSKLGWYSGYAPKSGALDQREAIDGVHETGGSPDCYCQRRISL